MADPRLHPQAARALELLAETPAQTNFFLTRAEALALRADIAALVAECDAQRERIQELEEGIRAALDAVKLDVQTAKDLLGVALGGHGGAVSRSGGES